MPNTREKLIELFLNAEQMVHVPYEMNTKEVEKYIFEQMADHLIANGVTVNEWISVKDRTPTEADGTVWVCLADVFPYNEKEPYIDAKHDGRITEAFYSQFSKRWYKDGAVFTDGVVTHWMEKAQPPKGE